MNSFRRDLLLTLTVKMTLLCLLWAVCVKPVEKPRLDPKQWMLGSVRSAPNLNS